MPDGTEAHDECKNCGASLDPSHVGPCPSCGELAGKNVYGSVTMTAQAKLSATGIVYTWRERYKVLLDTARRLRADGHPEAAIVMAQTACEVCTEVVLTDALRARVGDDAVADFITDPLRDYNLKNDRVKALYEFLFGHRIQKHRSLWQPFSEHVKRRNAIVHGGKSATPQAAEKSIAAVDKVIQHLLKNIS